MAEAATKTTNPRARRTSAAKKTTAAAATQAPVAEEAETSADTQKLTATLAPLADTKNYSTFDISRDVDGNATGCVGKFYAPLGTETVKVMIIGPAIAE